MKRLMLQTLVTAVAALSLTARAAEFQAPERWTSPYPAFRVIGNLYGVGTKDLAAWFLPTAEGHILINTGLADSTEIIRGNIESLGYSLEDVKILLTQQAHWDHVAAFAEIKALADAKVWATRDDARVLQDGGFSDPHFGGRQTFEPVSVDRILAEGDKITLGDTTLTVHEHPGHTEGSSSYTMTVVENGRTFRVAIVNMGTINSGKRLAVSPTYAGAAADFAYTYSAQKKMEVDIWVAAHNSQYAHADKYSPGQPYDPLTFVDPAGLKRAVERLEDRFIEVLASERIN